MNPFPSIVLRIAFVAGAIVLWFWTQRLIGGKSPVGDRMGDRLHDWTARWHAWLTVHPPVANLTLIVTSALVDAFGLYVLYLSIFGPTLQPFIALLILFGLRQVCQAISSLPSPPGVIWRHPGFPSIFVTYGTSNDFFFSGHTAIAVLGALQLAHQAPPWLVAVGAGVAFFEAATVIVLRAHYTMDVFTAPFVAWGADTIASHLAPAVDHWLARFG